MRSLEVVVDGRPYYRFAFDSFRFDQYPISGLIHDHRESHLGPTRFGYRLSPLPGNALASDLRPPGLPVDAIPGAFDLSDGLHRLEIEVTSTRGRASRARLGIVMARTDPARAPPLIVDARIGASDRLGVTAPNRMLSTVHRSALRAGAAGAGCRGRAPAECAVDPIAWRPRDGSMMGGGVSYARAAATGDAAGAPGLACLPSPGLAPLRIQMTEPARPASLDGSGFRIDLPAGGRFFPGRWRRARFPRTTWHQD